MQDVKFESLLGENIDKSSSLGSATNGFDENMYLISEPQVQFLGMPLFHIGIGTSPDKSIKLILLTFHGLNDPLFHKKMINAYGEEYKIMVRDKVLSQTTSTREEGEFKETLEKQEILLKIGTIKDRDISFIIWDKEGYTIEFIPKFGLHFKKS